MKLYHGTQIQNIKKLEPVATRDNAITKPVICFTPNSCIALFYIWNRSYKWVTFSEKENGKVVFTEHYKNMLFDFYNKVSGSIYKCDGDNPAITPSHMKGIYISETPIAIENEIQIMYSAADSCGLLHKISRIFSIRLRCSFPVEMI